MNHYKDTFGDFKTYIAKLPNNHNVFENRKHVSIQSFEINHDIMDFDNFLLFDGEFNEGCFLNSEDVQKSIFSNEVSFLEVKKTFHIMQQFAWLDCRTKTIFYGWITPYIYDEKEEFHVVYNRSHANYLYHRLGICRPWKTKWHGNVQNQHEFMNIFTDYNKKRTIYVKDPHIEKEYFQQFISIKRNEKECLDINDLSPLLLKCYFKIRIDDEQNEKDIDGKELFTNIQNGTWYIEGINSILDNKFKEMHPHYPLLEELDHIKENLLYPIHIPCMELILQYVIINFHKIEKGFFNLKLFFHDEDGLCQIDIPQKDIILYKHLELLQNDENKGDDFSFFCKCCLIQCNGPTTYQMHLESKKHHLRINQQNSNKNNVDLYCSLCNISCNSSDQLNQHKQSTKHKKFERT